jgi:hypothetical protein
MKTCVVAHDTLYIPDMLTGCCTATSSTDGAVILATWRMAWGGGGRGGARGGYREKETPRRRVVLPCYQTKQPGTANCQRHVCPLLTAQSFFYHNIQHTLSSELSEQKAPLFTSDN